VLSGFELLWVNLPFVQGLDRIHSFLRRAPLVYASKSAIEEIELRPFVYFLDLAIRHVLKNRIQHYLKEAIEHFWNDVLHPFIVDSNVWVGIDLNEPDSKILIDHEVEPKELEGVLPLVRV